jgi:glucose/arabinose dehydrogenase
MQNTGSTVDPARWEHVVPNGDYDVVVSVGDAAATDSLHKLKAENATLVYGFTPTQTTKFLTKSAHVTVSDGKLTLDAAGGTNTKINYVQIKTATATRRVLSVDPTNGATDVPVTSSVTLGLSHVIDNSQAVLQSLQVVRPDGTVLSGTYNGDAAGSLITFTPSVPLVTNTQYSVRTTSALKDVQGYAFQPFSSSFTTSSQGVPPPGVNFTKSTIDSSLPAASVVTLGPDGNLYAASGSGQIRRYQLDSNGVPTGVVTNINAFANQRIVLGLAFDPRSTASNLMLWVSNGAMGFDNMPNFTGGISLLTGSNLTTRRDVITGLPRSVKDHMNNGIAFGPDGKLYIAQGSLSGFGAPDAAWGNRAETPLSAAILVADVVNDSRFSGVVSVNTSAGYDAASSTAPVKTYATGVRNPYDLVWHTNGSLYVPVNESAGGNAPAGPNNSPPALSNLPAGRDFLARVQSGRYYGHPNPSIGRYVLNGGNPTSGTDPFETPQYPVGVQPHYNWQAPVLDLGLHRSANGITEYRSNAFSGQLFNQLLLAEFSGGDDILAIKLNSDGTVASKTVIYAGLLNPLDVTSGLNGNIYLAEYGDTATGSGGKITLLRPAN